MINVYRLAKYVIPLFALMVVVLFFYIKLTPIPEKSTYVGSAECIDCHSEEHNQWSGSLHPKMMRLVKESGAVVADLSDTSPNLGFAPEDAKWVIGSKWQQQFMGHDGKTETLLPGAWEIANKEWNPKNWDGWQVPVPLKRCHGCHVVGLNVETGEFVETGVGCETCHGPAQWHTKTLGLGKIQSILDAQICGQCHTRGKSIDGQYFFPNGYRPGKKLANYFKEIKPDYIQNSSQWWGNGHARKRHQEYFSWKRGGHSNSLERLKKEYDGQYGKVTGKCLTCHAAEAALRGDGHGLTLKDVKNDITCSVCHFVHGTLDKIRQDCNQCHSKGAYYHKPMRKQNQNHVPCPKKAKVQCINCHMPLTTKIAGQYQLHSHTPGIIPPKDTETFGVPNSCANGGCHQGKSAQWLTAAYEKHYQKTVPTEKKQPYKMQEKSPLTGQIKRLSGTAKKVVYKIHD